MIKVFDFFSGCGGTSCGFQQAGLEIVLGLDVDHDAAQTYRSNFPGAAFIEDDIRTLDTNALDPWMTERDSPVLFSGCAPCQPFSTYAHRYSLEGDGKWGLLYEFARLAKATNPEIITMENVPTVAKHEVFHEIGRASCRERVLRRV